MAETIQCSNCGAVLHEDDLFCGECSAPRPPATMQVEVLDEPQVNEIPGSEPGPARRPDPERKWRVAATVLVAIAAVLCVLGIIATVLFGLIPGEDLTPAENWIISATCCLLPIGGVGAIAGVAALVIWWTQLRDR
jgi:hypothetical protein